MNDLFPQAAAVGQTGKYMAAAGNTTSPYLFQYNFDTGTFNKTANPATLALNNAWSLAYSNNGEYIAISSQVGSPFIHMYKRSGATLTKIPFPSVPGYANEMAFSPDDTYLAYSRQTTGTHVFKRSGDTFTEITDTVLTSISTSSSHNCCAWSPDGLHLAVGRAASPFIKILKRTGDTFSDITPVTSVPTLSVKSITYNAGGSRMIYALDTTGTSMLRNANRSGDTYTLGASPILDSVPAARPQDIALSPDGTYLAIACNLTPFIGIYKSSGFSFVRLTDPTDIPTASAESIAFSADGNYLAIGFTSAPWMIIYSRSGDVFTKVTDPTTMPASGVYDVVFWPVAIPGSK